MTERDELEQVVEIERVQRLKALTGIASAVLVLQLLWAAFIFGHRLGPMQPSTVEILGGMVAMLLLAAVFGPALARRRRALGASYIGTLSEGRHRRRLLVFADCIIVDDEVITYGQLERWSADGEQLEVRYRDPRHDGPVLRTFEAPVEVVQRLQRRFEAPGAPDLQTSVG